MPDIPVERAADFRSRYATHVACVLTVFDVTLLCSQIRRGADGAQVLEQHTGLTLSWLQAKQLLVSLSVDVCAHEAQHGPIPVPAALLPQVIPPHPDDDPATRRVRQAVWDTFQRRRAELDRGAPPAP
jgi:hypothetical protein